MVHLLLITIGGTPIVTQYAAGGTPAAYFHNLWWYTTSCGASIANSNAAFSCIGVRSAGESCRSHKVRCLHLTVNSQWKLAWFSRQNVVLAENKDMHHNLCHKLWCIGVKSSLRLDFTLYWSSPYGLDQYASQPLRAEMQNKKRVDSVDQPLRAGPQYALSGLTAWRCLSVKSSRRLDFTVYTNFSFQKEKLVKRKVYVDLTSLTACEMHFYWHISGLTAWDLYAFQALRPEMQKEK